MDSSSMDCDVTFLVEGKQFSAHKSILAAQSPVFEAMFSRDTKEKFESQVCLSDVRGEVFEQFLNYLNTGKVSSSTDLNIIQLFEIADKYIVGPLKLRCENILCNQVTVEGVIELLQFSERHSRGALQKNCLNFISDYYFEVTNKDSWKYASKIEPTLLAEMFGGLALKYQPNEFPDFVPLDLPFDGLLDVTTTHCSKFSLTFESPTLNNKISSDAKYFFNVCADTNPALKFRLKWLFKSSQPGECALFIYYDSYSYDASTTNIFVDSSIAGMDNFIRMRSRDEMVLNKDIPSEISRDSSPIYSFFRLNPSSPKDIAICLKMTIYKESCKRSGFSDLKSLSFQRILLDLKSILESGKYCDVALLVEGKQFNTCKTILAAQSPVFEAMFSHDMKEKFESQVFLSDVTAEGFELFMNYLCTGKVSSSAYLKVMQLFEIADKYIVLLLRQQCDHILCNQVTIESAIELLQFSEQYSLDRLKQICLNFIIDHCLEVINNDSLKIASKIEPTLLAEMFGGLALKYQLNEIPDYVPLDLPFDASLEEAMTHHAMFRHTSELTFSKSSSLCGLAECNSHYVRTSPGLEFLVNWKFQNISGNEELLSISYRSTPDIFVRYSVKCMTNCKVTGRRLCLLHKRLSNEFSYDGDSFAKNSSASILISYYWRSQFVLNMSKADRFKDQDVDVSLNMVISKGSPRKYGFPQLKSLSRQQTLVDLKFMVDCGKHCDVVVLVKGKQFRAPKTILAAQSPVFEAMFRHDSNFKMLQNQVSLSDVTADVFELFLNHLYNGKVSSKTTLETVFGLFQFSERHSTVKLTQICIKFVVDHCLEVIDTDYLKNVSKIEPNLLMEMFRSLALRYRQNEFPDCVPIDLPSDASLEETMTHHQKFRTTFELKLPSGMKYPCNMDYLFVCSDTKPVLTFKLNWQFSNFCDNYQFAKAYLWIFYLSATKISTNFLVTCMSVTKKSGKRICTLNEHISSDFSGDFRSNGVYIGGINCPQMNCDFSLKINIYKESCRNVKSGVPELKPLLRPQLLLDLKSMLEDGKHCDVVLLVEGKQFSAHKTILVNRSNVFEAMFRYDMKEKIENRVEMDDVKIDVFEQFVLYLYTGKIDFRILEKYSMNLFVLADMHYLSTLAQMCLRMFGQSLTSESVSEQFELADRVGLTEFKQVCTDYMNKTN